MTANGANRPIVHLYALNWNERPLLPFFLEHYRAFVDQFFIFDNGSDDGSIEYLRQQPDVVLGSFVRDRDGYVGAAAEFYSNVWKASRESADWVVNANIDEFLHHPRPSETLAKLRANGVAAIRAVGWEMVAEEFPRAGPLVQTVSQGVRERFLDKVAIFNPAAVREINYAPGRHLARPAGDIGIVQDNVFDLLHFKYLGFAWLSERYATLNARRGEADVQNKWGVQYEMDRETLWQRFDTLARGARPVLLASAIRDGSARQLLPGCFLIRLRHNANERGGLREVWTQGETWAREVRHIYLTTTHPGVVKAWYTHRHQADRVTAVSGRVRFALIHPERHRQGEPPVVVELDADDPQLLIIPHGTWHGFKALGEAPAVLLHANDMPYNWIDLDELRRPRDAFAFQW